MALLADSFNYPIDHLYDHPGVTGEDVAAARTFLIDAAGIAALGSDLAEQAANLQLTATEILMGTDSEMNLSSVDTDEVRQRLGQIAIQLAELRGRMEY